MAERRRSLLDFAIAASLAVLPVMLGVVWLVAVVRPADPHAALRLSGTDRYASVRHIAALKTFEPAIVARPVAAPPSADAVLAGVPACRLEWGERLDTRRWLLRQIGADVAVPTPAEQVAARLAELDAALLRFSSRVNPRVERPLGLDAGRWFAAARQSLATPLSAAPHDARRFELGCADLANALAALVRSDARLLDSLSWRGTTGKATLAQWPAGQQVAIGESQVMRRNPWSGVAGCIFLGGPADGSAPSLTLAGPRSAQRRTCAVAGAQVVAGEPGPVDAVDDPRWSVPPSLQTVLQPLDALRQPSQALYRQLAGDLPAGAAAPHRRTLDGAAVDVGYSIGLTIDPALQALAQKTAACYTGRHDVCRSLAMHRTEDRAPEPVAAKGRAKVATAPAAQRELGQALLEGAMVRMAAVAVIDVASGRIEALAGALSPCARQEVDGPGRAADCDRRLPYPIQFRPDALLNPALFHDAMPASTIKPVMAAAFLVDPKVGPRWLAAERVAMKGPAGLAGPTPTRDSLRGQLMRSDSARFLDRMFCFDTAFIACRRPWDVQASAGRFGWNGGCDAAQAGVGPGCGRHDLLFGRSTGASAAAAAAQDPAAPDAAPEGVPSLPVAYGRLMSEPRAGRAGATLQLTPPMRLDPGIVQRCASGADGRRGSDDDWEKCKGGAVVDVVAEGWGQGHARASALGVAGMMATLAAAGNGQAELRAPYLVASVRRPDGVDASNAPGLAGWQPAPPHALGLSREASEVILSGLSHSHRAGTARTACEQVFDAARCRDLGWLAGKTGTPSFPSDGLSLDEIGKLCSGAPAADASDRRAARPPAACSSLRPYKWYVAAYRADGASAGPWTKAIAVLTERNWLARNGQVHGAGDHGPNPSAEIAMQIAGRQVGAIAPAKP